MNEFVSDFKQLALFENIKKQINTNKFSHAELVLCDDDFSAKIFSKLIALTLLCSSKNACMTCQNCLQALSEVHTDLFVFPKGKTFMVSDSELVIEKAYQRPAFSDRKVILINDFDTANIASQNKILKILEEPSENTYFVINAENSKKILPTIKSRMQIVVLPALSKKELENVLKNHNLDYTSTILSFSDGYLGRAIALLKNKNFLPTYDFIIDLLKNMKSSKDIIEYSGTLANKENFVLSLEIFEKIFRNLLCVKLDEKLLVDEVDIMNIKELENYFSEKAILSIMQRLILAKQHFDANVNLNSICDNLLLGILEDKYLWK